MPAAAAASSTGPGRRSGIERWPLTSAPTVPSSCFPADRTPPSASPGRSSASPASKPSASTTASVTRSSSTCARAFASGSARSSPNGRRGSATTMSSSSTRSPPFPTRALTRETAIEIADNGLPTTFVPGRNLIFFCLRRRARLSPRRPPHRRRHVRDRLFRLSRLPRRHRQGDAGGAQPRPRQARRHPHAADVGRQGRHLRHGRGDRRRSHSSIVVVEDTHSCYLGDRTHRHDWGYRLRRVSGLPVAGGRLCDIHEPADEN